MLWVLLVEICNVHIIESLHRRRSKTGKKTAYNARGGKRKRNKNKLHDNHEIDALMRRHGDRVKVVYETNP